MEIINVSDEVININVTEEIVNIVTETGAYPLPSNVFSVFGRVGNVVGQAGDYTTSIVAEGTNLYYTNARSRAAISETITGINYDSASGIFSMASGYVIPTQVMLDAKQDDLNGTGIVKSTGGTISYLTDNTANWDAAYNDKINSAAVTGTSTKTLTLNQQDGGTITASWTDDNTDAVTSVFGRTGAVVSANGDYTTSQVTEGSNLYFTNARVHSAISGTAPISEVSGVISIAQSNTTTDGYLSATDWNTFNNKQPLITAGTTAQYYRGDKTFQTLDTLAVPENTNLYYTDARARAAITGTAPISVTSGVVSISQASGASNGYLSSTDFTTFNNKQTALNGTGFVKISGTTISYDNNTYLTTISGIAAGGELSGTYANPTLVNSAVTGKILTGLNLVGGGTIADTDSILAAFGKVQNQISALVGGVMYEGTWNASTNTPTITSSVGSKGDYYVVATAGNTNINGITDWKIGDWIIFNGTTWDKVDNTDAVSSVNGYTGAVSLVTSDVAESGSLYFTNARAIGSTLTGYTSGSGVVAATDTILQAIQKLNGNVSGLVTGVSSVFGRTGAVVATNGDYNTSQVTENTNLYYTEGRVSANTDVAANTAARHAAVTIGTANGLSLSTQALSLAAANTTTTGALTSTDWNTFNGKQAALNGTGFVKISGTTISYDNSTYLTTSSASSTYLPLAGGTLTGALGGTTGTFSGILTTPQVKAGTSAGLSINANSGTQVADFGAGGSANITFFGGLSGTSASFSSSVTASSLIKSGGTSSQFLKADGSVDSSTYLTTSAASSTYLPLAGGTLTGALSGTSATFSGNVNISSASTNGFVVNSTNNASYRGFTIQVNGTTQGGMEILPNTGEIRIGGYSSTSDYFPVIYSDGVAALTFGIGAAPTATFSSDVTISKASNTDYLALKIENRPITASNTSSGYIGFYSNPGNGSDNTISTGRIYGKFDANSYGEARLTFSTVTGFDVYQDVMTLKGTNVGIGTSSPNQKLTIAASTNGYVCLSENSRNVSGDKNMVWTFGNNANNSSSYFLVCSMPLGDRMYILGNGNIENINNSYGALSDIKLKENIVDATPKLENLLKVKIRNYNLIGEETKQIGVIAQELEEIFPSMVDEKEDFDKDGNDLGTTTKSVKYSIFVPMLIKAIQELEARIKQLENK